MRESGSEGERGRGKELQWEEGGRDRRWRERGRTGRRGVRKDVVYVCECVCVCVCVYVCNECVLITVSVRLCVM